MQKLRDRLALAIEVISIVTAIGIVISVFTYSILFGMLEVSYLGVATLSDMLRDSMQFLIRVLLVSSIFLPTLTFADYIWVKRQDKLPLESYWTMIIGLGLSVVVGLLVQSVVSVGALVEAKAYRDGPHHSWWLNSVLFGGMFMFNWVYNMVRRNSTQQTVLIGLAVIMVGTIGATGNSLWDTMKSDLPADIRPVDKGLCKGRYTVLWLGESRMMARCEKGRHIVVKLIK